MGVVIVVVWWLWLYNGGWCFCTVVCGC